MAFCHWLLLPSIKVPPSDNMCQYLVSFYCQMIFHCMDIPHFSYPFISRCTVGLFPLFGYQELCCHEHLLTSFGWMCAFISLGYKLGVEEWNDPVIGNSMFNILKNCQTICQSVFTILLAICKSSNFSTSLSTLVIVYLFFLS